MHVDHPNPFNRFKSLDREYFIYGYKNGILSNRYHLSKLREMFLNFTKI